MKSFIALLLGALAAIAIATHPLPAGAAVPSLAALARIYSAPGGNPWEAAQGKHCQQVASELSAAAKTEHDLAAEHEQVASSLGK